MKKLFFIVILIVAAHSIIFAEEAGFDWYIASPQDVGLGEQKITAFRTALLPTEVTSCIIVRYGKIALEYYKSGYNETTVFPMNSASKSITSAIVGIAIEQGCFALDDRIVRFFPGLSSKANTDYAKITVRHLLTNTSGLVSTDSALWGLWLASDNWIDFLFDRPMQHKPGSVFDYSTGNTHILSVIIAQTTGKSLNDYGHQVLFAPLGLNSAYFDDDPQGISDGGNGLHLTARDMARFGLLYLHNGVWQDKHLVPSEWVTQSTNIQTSKMARYGYQWWIRYFGKKQLKGYFAHGWGEQVIAVIPDADLVITFTSSYPDNRKNAVYWQWIGNIVDAAAGK